MHILLLTYGTRGDVQPYVALGTALMRKGHTVTLATSTRFEDFVREHGLKFAPLNDGLLNILESREGKNMLDKGGHKLAFLKQAIKIARTVKPMQKALLTESWEAATIAKPDFILFHPKCGAAPSIAEKLGIPCAVGALIPMVVPTREYPFTAFPKMRLSGWLNKLSHRLIYFITNKMWKGYINEFRSHIGLPTLRKFDYLETRKGHPIPVLHAFSKTVIPHPADWPPTAHTTGYWFLYPDHRSRLAPDLEAFLQNGEPPVYIGFGSMAGNDPERMATIIIKALVAEGLRGVIVAGWGGIKAEKLPDSIIAVAEAPHTLLMHRTAAIVHHGGAGTTAAALLAGKPQVIIPFFGDQPFWGHRMHALGLAAKPIPKKELTAERLRAALRQIVNTPEPSIRAEKIGQKIREENGCENACTLIENMLPGPAEVPVDNTPP